MLISTGLIVATTTAGGGLIGTGLSIASQKIGQITRGTTSSKGKNKALAAAFLAVSLSVGASCGVLIVDRQATAAQSAQVTLVP